MTVTSGAAEYFAVVGFGMMPAALWMQANPTVSAEGFSQGKGRENIYEPHLRYCLPVDLAGSLAGAGLLPVCLN